MGLVTLSMSPLPPAKDVKGPHTESKRVSVCCAFVCSVAGNVGVCRDGCEILAGTRTFSDARQEEPEIARGAHPSVG